jgi:D-aspartate ligase
MAVSDSTGAIVVGGDHPGLGVARSLGRRGIPVVIIDDQHSIAAFSRYVTHSVRVPDLRDARKTVEAVLDVGRRFNLANWVLFPTRDETVAAFSRYRAELATVFRVTTPEWNVVRWAHNKKNTYELATQLNIPCPQTFYPRSEDDLVPLYAKLPLAIKPAIKENFFYATGSKAWRAESPADLRRLFVAARRQIPPEEILVQEIVPGDGRQQFSYCAFCCDGLPHSSLMARRLRQHPHEFGRAATYVETTSLPEVEELSERFLKAIKYYGLVEIEYKLDPRDGQYKLLDVNARTWGFHSIGLPAGVDFPYLLFVDQQGGQTTHCRGQAGVGWVRLLTDIPTAVSQLFSRRIDAHSYFTSLKRVRVESVFCRDDPFPFIAEFALLPYLMVKKYP